MGESLHPLSRIREMILHKGEPVVGAESGTCPSDVLCSGLGRCNGDACDTVTAVLAKHEPTPAIFRNAEGIERMD